MNNLYEEIKIVRAYDVDFNNKIKISSVFNMLQDVAAVHADNLGLGFKDLYKHNFAWVLNWVKLEINDYPAFSDSVIIKTWPRCKHKLYSMRDYTIRNKDIQTLFNATSAWLPINTKTKRITDTKNLPKVINYQPDLIAVDEFPVKIIPGSAKEVLFNKKFRYTDIDINQHVNNTRYIELILDSYNTDNYSNRIIKSIAVTFSSECFFNDEIEISRSVKDGFDIIEGVNINTSKQTFISSIEWSAL
ncbi:MAG: thioesterase [Ignavibacteriaceae bacterium]